MNTGVLRTEVFSVIQRFLDYLVTVRGYSQNTILAYEHDLNLLAEFILKKNQRFSDVDTSTLIEFFKRLRNRGFSARTRERILSAIRSFYKYLVEEEGFESNPAELLDSPKKTKKLPEVLTIQEVELLLSAPDVTTLLGIRDRAILEFLYATGARVSETVNLRLSDVDLMRGLVRLRGKGNKVRLVPLSKPAITWLKRYLKEVRPNLGTKQSLDFLFINKSGGKMSRVSYWKMLKKYAIAVGLGKRVYPHILRHSFATHLLSNGCNLRILQGLLGHSSIATTEIYTHLTFTQIKEVFNRYHPRA